MNTGHGWMVHGRGATFVDTVACVTLCSVLTAASVPALLAGRDAYLASRAARHLAAVLAVARSQAIAGGRSVAVRFFTAPADGWETLADGNHNGVRLVDSERGIDVAVVPAQYLGSVAGQVRYGFVAGVTDIDTGSPLAGNPLRVSGALLSFSPTGSSSSGTVYLAGPGTRQHAVRVLGSTGRIRVLRFEPQRRVWTGP